MPLARNGNVVLQWEAHGGGEPILMVMGMTMSMRAWFRILPGMSEKYRAITFDNRGVGGSDRPLKAFTTADMARDAIAVMDAAGIERAHVLGASLGGMVAQRIALEHPERVRTLMLACTSASQNGDAGRSVRTTSALALRPLLGVKRAFTLLAPSLYSRRTLMERPGLVEEDLHQRMADRPPMKTAYYQLLAALRHDTRARLGEIKAPTLVIQGEQDRIISPSCARYLAEHIPSSELVVLPHCGHIITTDAGDEALNAMFDFLARHSDEIRVHQARARSAVAV